jgi:hypothetical protein
MEEDEYNDIVTYTCSWNIVESGVKTQKKKIKSKYSPEVFFK